MNPILLKLTVYIPPAAVTVTGPTGGRFCGNTTLTAKNYHKVDDGTIYFQGSSSGGTRIDLAGSPQIVNSSGRYYFRALSNTGCWGQEGFIDVTLSLAPSAIGTAICQAGSGALISASSCPTVTNLHLIILYPDPTIPELAPYAWTATGNVTSASSYATASNIPINGGITNYLIANHYGFNIPENAEIRRNNCYCKSFFFGKLKPIYTGQCCILVRGGTIAGVNRALFTSTIDWPTSMGTISYGGPTDTWG